MENKCFKMVSFVKPIYNIGTKWENGFVELWSGWVGNLNQESREEMVATIATSSYGNETAKDPAKLYKRLQKLKHESVFEFITPAYFSDRIRESLRHENLPTFEQIAEGNEEILTQLMLDHASEVATFKIKCPIFVARQFMRHRGASYLELCVSGDTLIHTSKGKRKIKDLYEQQYKKGTDGRLPRVKSYNFETKEFFYTPIKEVFKTGTKKIFEVTVQVNQKRYKIKTSLEHKFLTKNGWVRLKNLKEGDFIAVNGQPLYRNKEWLLNKKNYYTERGISLKDWVKIEGLNYNTVRVWLRKHGITYTPLEALKCRKVWNKGLKGEQSHAYGMKHPPEVRKKISEKLVKDYLETKGGFRNRVANYWYAEFRRKKVLEKYNYKCAYCGAKNELELDHIKPVNQYPELAFDYENIQVLCKNCHREKTKKEVSTAKRTIKFGIIESIKFVGEEETYDLEVEHKDHNYVANGIVVHNSRRYVKNNKVPFEFYMPEIENYNSLDYGDKQNIERMFEDTYDYITTIYEKALEIGLKPEQARAVQPVGAYTTFWVQMDKDNLVNFFNLRLKKDAQEEIRKIAVAMLDSIKMFQSNLYNKIIKEL